MQPFLILCFPQLRYRIQEERIAKKDDEHQYVPVMLGLVHCDHEAVPFHKQSQNQEYREYLYVSGQRHREPP